MPCTVDHVQWWPSKFFLNPGQTVARFDRSERNTAIKALGAIQTTVSTRIQKLFMIRFQLRAFFDNGKFCQIKSVGLGARLIVVPRGCFPLAANPTVCASSMFS